MALLVASRPPVPHGQVTSTIYGHLREGRYDEAIQILEYELQVPVCWAVKMITAVITSGPSLYRVHLSIYRLSHVQNFPTSRAALSLLAFALFQSEDFSAAAAL